MLSVNIGPNRKPVLTKSKPNTIKSKESFYQWYNDVEGVNIPIPIELNFTNNDGTLGEEGNYSLVNSHYSFQLLQRGFFPT